jgi:hypothetical protein
VWQSIAANPRPARGALFAVGGAVLVIGLVCIREPTELALFLPRPSIRWRSAAPATSWSASAPFFPVAFSIGSRVELSGAAEPRWPGSAVAFLLAFAAYARAGSAPRWRAFEIDLARVARPVVQRITLREPLPGPGIRAVHWFVDLRSQADPPPLRVGIGGEWLHPSRYAWRRTSCNPNDDFEETPVEVARCFWYTEGLSAFTGAFPGAPQWWSLEIAKELVAGRGEVSLVLGVAPEASGGAPVLLGGAFGREPPDRFYGPVLRAAGFLPATSLYRWHVEEDWRLWGAQPLASVRTESLVPLPAEAASGRAAREQRLVAAATSRRQAHLNIRLLVTYADGSRVLF